MLFADKLNLEADYAHTLHDDEEAIFDNGKLTHVWNWTGWQNRHWPAEVVRPGLMIYKFDKRKRRRQLCVLVEVKMGGSFQFSSMNSFVEQVERLTGMRPNPADGDDDFKKWQEVETRLAKAGTCAGICMTGDVIRSVSISLSRTLPRIGWIDLTKPNNGMHAKLLATLAS